VLVARQGALFYSQELLTMPKLKDRTQKVGGRSAAFQLRINPELHAQLRTLTDDDNVTLACWLKELARRELRRRGIEPRG
jgi:predicted HicB family RNase H-like nuclease